MIDIATFARGAAAFLERIRKEERAGVMGEPTLEVTGKISRIVTADDPPQTRSFIRYDDLIALIKAQNGAGE